LTVHVMAAEGEDVPPPDESQEQPEAPQQIWIYGINDHLDVEMDELKEKVADVVTGNFRKDYVNICQSLDFVAHSAFARKQIASADDPSEVAQAADNARHDDNLSVNSILMDKLSMMVLSVLLPACHHLVTVKFSNCKLDLEMLQLLREGITEAGTVRSVFFDYNPLDLPLELKTERSNRGELTQEDLDGLEMQRQRNQEFRKLRSFREVILRKYKTIDECFKKLDRDKNKSLDVHEFMLVFDKNCDIKVDEVFECFEIMDGPSYGDGDGRLNLDELHKALDSIPEVAEDEEMQDPIGTVLALFVNESSVIEELSMRSCEIGRLEMRAICSELGKVKHLRCVNLWGNRLEDVAMKYLSDALVDAHSVQYLGLGLNRITDAGLKLLVEVAGALVIRDKDKLHSVQVKIKHQETEKAAKEKEKAKTAVPPPADPKGRERWHIQYHIDELVDMGEAPDGTGPVWWNFRNKHITEINVSENFIEDLEVIEEIQPRGVTGHSLILWRNPVCQKLIGSPLLAAESGWVLHGVE